MKFRPVREMMESELEKWKTIRRIAAISYLVLNTVYMVYRFTIINPNSLFLSSSYFIAEVFQFILGITYIYMSWNFRRRKSPPTLQDVSVEVWVPVYREPIDVIRRTLRAAKNIDHPHDTRVFDDGRREDVKELAAEFGIKYFSRQNNTDAKAGNLNFALENSTAEFIMVFDADHIALPSAIDDLLGYFRDPEVALVQSPQDYYNSDAFQYFNSKRKGGIWHDQSFFYLFGLPSMDHDQSASCVGTGVIYRRAALTGIGGIPTDTATEDIHTSLRLMKHQWKTVYHNDPVAYGIAAANLEEYYKTRHRWAHGNLHVLSLEGVPFTRGMSIKQRLHHLSLGLIYLEGWQQLLLLLIPVIALITGWQPFIITPLNVLIVLCYPLLSILLLQELGSGYSRIWANEIFSMARWPVHIISVLGIFRRKILWKSSSKLLQTQTTISRVLPQICIFILSAVGLAVAVKTLSANFDKGVLLSGTVSDMTTPLEEGYTVDILFVAGGWAIYNMVRVGVFLKRAWHKSNVSDNAYRFELQLPIELTTNNASHWCHTQWISEHSICIRIEDMNTMPVRGDRVKFVLPLPTGCIDGEVTLIQVTTSSDRYVEVVGDICMSTQRNSERLSDALYSVGWYRDLRANRTVFLTPVKWAWRLVSGRALQRYAILDEFSVLCSSEGKKIFITLHHGEEQLLFTTYDTLNPDESYSLYDYEQRQWTPRKVSELNRESVILPKRIGAEGKTSHQYVVS